MYRSTLETHLNEFVNQNYNRSEVEEVVRIAMNTAVRKLPDYLFDVDKTGEKSLDALYHLLGIISNVIGIPVSKIRCKRRKREYVIGRHLFFYFSWKYYSKMFSLKTIGAVCSKCDHTTVIHGKSTIMDLLESKDDIITPYYNKIKSVMDSITTDSYSHFNMLEER
jgi:chromosomal replication initiation ATPase DnaA